MGVGREASISLDGVRDKNVMQLKKLNTALFPVRYNDKYYADAISSGDFTKLGANSPRLKRCPFCPALCFLFFPVLSWVLYIFGAFRCLKCVSNSSLIDLIVSFRCWAFYPSSINWCILSFTSLIWFLPFFYRFSGLLRLFHFCSFLEWINEMEKSHDRGGQMKEKRGRLWKE